MPGKQLLYDPPEVLAQLESDYERMIKHMSSLRGGTLRASARMLQMAGAAPIPPTAAAFTSTPPPGEQGGPKLRTAVQTPPNSDKSCAVLARPGLARLVCPPPVCIPYSCHSFQAGLMSWGSTISAG